MSEEDRIRVACDADYFVTAAAEEYYTKIEFFREYGIVYPDGRVWIPSEMVEEEL